MPDNVSTVALLIVAMMCFASAYARGLQVSQAAGAVSEGAMGYGVMTGLTVGSVCALGVAVWLSRKLFHRVPGSPNKTRRSGGDQGSRSGR